MSQVAIHKASVYARKVVNEGLKRADAPRLHIVPRPLTGAPRTPFVVLVLTLLAVGLFGLLMLHTNMQEGSFALNDTQRTNRSLAEQVQALQEDLDKHSAPGELAVRAQDLGMVPSTSAAYLDLESKTISGALVPAIPGTLVTLGQEVAPESALGPVQSAPVKPTPKPAPKPTPAVTGATGATPGGGSAEPADDPDGGEPELPAETAVNPE